MLHDNQVKEHLALAYVYAVATLAKCSFDKPTVDNDSVDVKLTLRNDEDAEAIIHSPEVALQLKAHQVKAEMEAELEKTTGSLPFFLKKKNYDDLRKRTQTPRLLVVVALPSDPTKWLSLSPNELILRRCGYWINLLGEPATDNPSGKTIHLPLTQVFDPETLARLMRLAARQERLQ